MRNIYPHYGLRFLRELGRGGIGVVDAVEVVGPQTQLARGRVVACKYLSAKWARSASVRARFHAEMRILLSLIHHPNVVDILSYVPNGSHCFYLMPLCDGSLDVLLKKGHRFESIERVASVGAVLATTLAFAHKHGIFHRDLKPANIFVGEGGRALIGDWGIGRAVHDATAARGLTRPGLGTRAYCPIEQWLGQPVDATADVYSLGMVLAEAATGTLPPVGEEVGTGILVSWVPGEGRPTAAFNALLRRMTRRDRRLRHASMDEVAVDLGTIARGAVPAWIEAEWARMP